MTIWFDMDGTLCDLYGVKDWLPMLRNYDPTPYAQAKPLWNMLALASLLRQVQAKGYKVGIISWCSKCSTPAYDAQVKLAKTRWLLEQLDGFTFDSIKIVPYGTDKWFACGCEGVLFDDELNNRTAWGNGLAYEPSRIFSALSCLL